MITRAFRNAMGALHRRGRTAGLDPKLLSNPDVRSLIDAHTSVLDSAIQKAPMSEAMRRALGDSNFIFSGIKVFHELNEAFPSLVDSNGDLKSFEQFLNDVQKIDQTYNRNYLRAEYNFAVAAAQGAGHWEQIEADGDRYDLQYRATIDDRTREEHLALNGVTLPPSHPFWQEFYPPNGWNCRCRAVQVRKGKYPNTDPDVAVERGNKALARDKKGIFRFNPGQQHKTFPDYNPYTIRRCRDCDIASGKATLARMTPPENELCQACRVIREMRTKEATTKLSGEERENIRKAANTWADKHLPKVTLNNGDIASRVIIDTENGDNLIINKPFFSETFTRNKHNPQLSKTMELATLISEWAPDLKFISTEKGIHHKCPFRVYEALYQGLTIQLKAMDRTPIIAYTMRIISQNKEKT